MRLLKDRSGSPLSAVVFALLVFVPIVSGQDDPLMDGMCNITTNLLNANSSAAALYERRCSQCHDNRFGLSAHA